MFGSIKNYLLRKEIKRTSKVQKQFVEWSKVQSAVVLVNSLQLEEVKDFVKQSGKNFDIIVLNEDNASENKDCTLSLNKKSFNFFDLPKPDFRQKISNKTYDILINTDFSNTTKMKTLTGLIPAKCKLGPQSTFYNGFFDISIQSKQTEFLKQALKYLMMIKS